MPDDPDIARIRAEDARWAESLRLARSLDGEQRPWLPTRLLLAVPVVQRALDESYNDGYDDGRMDERATRDRPVRTGSDVGPCGCPDCPGLGLCGCDDDECLSGGASGHSPTSDAKGDYSTSGGAE